MLLEVNNDVFGVIFYKLDLIDKCRLGLTNKVLSNMIYGRRHSMETNGSESESESLRSLSNDYTNSQSLQSSFSEYLIDEELGRQAHACGVTLSFEDGDITRSAVMQLLFGKCCMFCSKSRVRKVYKPFNIRCCTDCLYDQTISSYELNATYNVSDHALSHTHPYSDIPFMSVEKFNPNSSYYRYYTMNFYWIKTIERVVFRGKSLSVMRGIVQRQRDHEESLRRREEERKLADRIEKKQPRILKIREYISEMGEDIDSDSHSRAFKDALASYMNRSIPPPTKKAFIAKWESLQSI